MTQAAPDSAARRGHQRIDKWLWHARMVRTRTDAAKLVEAGHCRIGGQRVTAPAQAVRVGDVVTLALDRSVRVVEVTGFCERRGSPQDAAKTFRFVESTAA